MSSPDSSLESTQLLSEEVIKAVKENNVPRLKQLKEAGECFNLCDNLDNTLLHIAIMNEQETTIDTFKYLLTVDEIAKEALNSDYRSPLMEACQYQMYSPDFARLLIEQGCGGIEIAENGNSLLHMAINNAWSDIAELLIERGWDVNGQNYAGETPLHLATARGSVDDVWMLLFYGADPNFTFDQEMPYTADYTAYSYLVNWVNCFDIAALTGSPEMKEIFLDKLGCCKSFGLSTFVEAMEREMELFAKLLDITYDLNYTYNELREFCKRIAFFKPEFFELFVQNFPYVVEEMIERCCLDEAFICGNPYYLQNYTRNLFILFESNVVECLVHEINSSRLPIISYVIESFASHRDDAEVLTQVICCMLSYGVNMTAEAINDIYFGYGYCDLFKMMLHMDVKNINRYFTCKHVIPKIIYDVNMTTDLVIAEDRYDEPTIYRISKYFALPKLKKQIQKLPDVPTLVELARNRTRQYIIDKFKTKNSMQFYTILQWLPISNVYKKIISFEKQLYWV